MVLGETLGFGLICKLRRISFKFLQSEISVLHYSSRLYCFFSPPRLALLLFRMAFSTVSFSYSTIFDSSSCLLEETFMVDGILQLSTRYFSSTFKVGLTRTLGIFSMSTLFFSCRSMADLIISTSLYFWRCKFSTNYLQVFDKSAVAMCRFW